MKVKIKETKEKLKEELKKMTKKDYERLKKKEGYKIKDVRTGNNDNIIVFVLEKKDYPSYVITWDIE